MNEEDTKVADIFEKDIENFGNNLDKMIEHLNIVIATHNKQVEEIERLNDIINELEHQLYQEWLEWKDSDCESIYVRAFEDKAIYDYLQELKGSDGAIPPEVIGTNREDGDLFDYGDR